MTIDNIGFNNDRKNIEAKLRTMDLEGHYLVQATLGTPLFIKRETNRYQIMGINSSIIEGGKYIEIFVAVDLITTLENFNGSSVKVFYFDQNTINDTSEISLVEAKQGYSRPEWRRLQKFLKKEANKIVRYNKFEKTEKDEQAESVEQVVQGELVEQVELENNV